MTKFTGGKRGNPLMYCAICASRNQTEFTAEINIHFPGHNNVDHPGVLVFPKVLVCLDCGSSYFSTPEAELSQLARGAATRQVSTLRENARNAVLRRSNRFGA